MTSPHLAFAVETSNDGEQWRKMGTVWAFPSEPVLVHGASKYLRYKAKGESDWVGPLERTGNECMAFLNMDEGSRTDIFPGDEHLGLPVFLPGGETGRLLRFEHAADGYSWTYALEFQGEVPARFRDAAPEA